MYLEHVSVAGTMYALNNGNAGYILGDVELEIGGQRIDKHTGHWMETWAELTEPNPTGSSVCSTGVLLQQVQRQLNIKICLEMAGGTNTTRGYRRYFVPLQFGFAEILVLLYLLLLFNTMKLK